MGVFFHVSRTSLPIAVQRGEGDGAPFLQCTGAIASPVAHRSTLPAPALNEDQSVAA